MVHVSGGCGSHGKGLCPKEQSKDKLLKQTVLCLICFRSRVPSLILPRGIASGPATLDLCPDTTGCVTSPGTPSLVLSSSSTKQGCRSLLCRVIVGMGWGGVSTVALKCKVSWELRASLSRAKAWAATDDDIWKMSMTSQLDPLLARFHHHP